MYSGYCADVLIKVNREWKPLLQLRLQDSSPAKFFVTAANDCCRQQHNGRCKPRHLRIDLHRRQSYNRTLNCTEKQQIPKAILLATENKAQRTKIYLSVPLKEMNVNILQACHTDLGKWSIACTFAMFLHIHRLKRIHTFLLLRSGADIARSSYTTYCPIMMMGEKRLSIA